MELKFEQLVLGPLSTNCYILFGPNDFSIVIDPADRAADILAVTEKEASPLVAVVLTHGHFDHIGALSGLTVPVYVHSADRPFLGMEWNQHSECRDLEEGEIILAGLRLEIINTPGHTSGSVCVRVGNHLFSGDTLFKHGVGRTDLPGGSMIQMQESLQKLMRLPLETIVHPGHGPATTIEEEKQENMFL